MNTEKGTVIRRTKGFYFLKTNAAETVECKVKGNLFKDSRFDNQIAVGDMVRFTRQPGASAGLITAIEPRESFLSRSRVGIEAEQIIAANVDFLLIVAATRKPPFRSNLVNRMLTAAEVGRVTPVLVITKTDLAQSDEIEAIVEPYRNLDLEIHRSSIKDPGLCDRLQQLLTHHVCLLAGQSGTGKSSLLNRFFPSLNLQIGQISAKTAKGSHTTTYARMFQVADEGFVIDTPGIREFGLWGVTRKNLSHYFPGLKDIRDPCRHRDCVHIHEPDCAIKTAVTEGKLHPRLYQSYQAIYESLP